MAENLHRNVTETHCPVIQNHINLRCFNKNVSDGHTAQKYQIHMRNVGQARRMTAHPQAQHEFQSLLSSFHVSRERPTLASERWKMLKIDPSIITTQKLHMAFGVAVKFYLKPCLQQPTGFGGDSFHFCP